MMEAQIRKPADLALLGVCVLSVPLVQTVFLAWEYLLVLPLAGWVHALILVAAAAGSLLVLVARFHSRVQKAVAAVALVVWNALAYLAVSFYIGCRWAPSCV
jgi:hypothetical protein